MLTEEKDDSNQRISEKAQFSFGGTNEKIKVFISSSMRDEGCFSWKSCRKELKEGIDSTDLFQVFEIEDHVSPIPSRNFYLNNVEQCDVLVALVREELRPGTEEEIRYAINLRKPIMMVVIGHKKDQNTEDLIHYIHSKDYATTQERDTVEGLASFVVSELNGILLLLFKNASFRLGKEEVFGVDIDDASSSSIDTDIIKPFGESTGLLSKSYGYSFLQINNTCVDPYLEPLGRSIFNWVTTGIPFNLEPFFESIYRAMRKTEIGNDTLEFRLKALNSFINGRYEEAYEYVENARVSISNKGSWLYGNVLIDRRNLALFIGQEKTNLYYDTKKEIEKSGTQTLFPLAVKFEKNVLSQIEKTSRKKRMQNPRSVTFDNTLAAALNNALSYIFVSTLYGSIASFYYGRNLIARTLIDFSEIYTDDNLLIDGMKLFALSGEDDGFSSCCRAKRDQISNRLKAEANQFWNLSNKAPKPKIPRLKCCLAQYLSPYFDDEIFVAIQDYFLRQDLFSYCRDAWLKAIDSIKLRIDPKKFISLLEEIIACRLYVPGNTFQNIILNYDYSQISLDDKKLLAHAIKNHRKDLIRENYSLGIFGLLEKETGLSLIGKDEILAANDFEKARYYNYAQENGKILESCLEELLRQYEDNNNEDKYIGFGYIPENPICFLLSEDPTEEQINKVRDILDRILHTIKAYKGSLSSLYGPLKVFAREICTMKQVGIATPSSWVEIIADLDIDYQLSFRDSFFEPSNSNKWKIYIQALRVISGIDNPIIYLSKGITISEFNLQTQELYAELLGWMISTKIFNGEELKGLVKAVCIALLNNKFADVRVRAVDCLAECLRLYGKDDLVEYIYNAMQDSSDSVVFRVLMLCKRHRFDNDNLEYEIIENLSRDANWFIRWHAMHA